MIKYKVLKLIKEIYLEKTSDQKNKIKTMIHSHQLKLFEANMERYLLMAASAATAGAAADATSNTGSAWGPRLSNLLLPNLQELENGYDCEDKVDGSSELDGLWFKSKQGAIELTRNLSEQPANESLASSKFALAAPNEVGVPATTRHHHSIHLANPNLNQGTRSRSFALETSWSWSQFAPPPPPQPPPSLPTLAIDSREQRHYFCEEGRSAEIERARSLLSSSASPFESDCGSLSSSSKSVSPLAPPSPSSISLLLSSSRSNGNPFIDHIPSSNRVQRRQEIKRQPDEETCKIHQALFSIDNSKQEDEEEEQVRVRERREIEQLTKSANNINRHQAISTAAAILFDNKNNNNNNHNEIGPQLIKQLDGSGSGFIKVDAVYQGNELIPNGLYRKRPDEGRAAAATNNNDSRSSTEADFEAELLEDRDLSSLQLAKLEKRIGMTKNGRERSTDWLRPRLRSGEDDLMMTTAGNLNVVVGAAPSPRNLERPLGSNLIDVVAVDQLANTRIKNININNYQQHSSTAYCPPSARINIIQEQPTYEDYSYHHQLFPANLALTARWAAPSGTTSYLSPSAAWQPNSCLITNYDNQGEFEPPLPPPPSILADDIWPAEMGDFNFTSSAPSAQYERHFNGNHLAFAQSYRSLDDDLLVDFPTGIDEEADDELRAARRSRRRQIPSSQHLSHGSGLHNNQHRHNKWHHHLNKPSLPYRSQADLSLDNDQFYLSTLDYRPLTQYQAQQQQQQCQMLSKLVDWAVPPEAASCRERCCSSMSTDFHGDMYNQRRLQLCPTTIQQHSLTPPVYNNGNINQIVQQPNQWPALVPPTPSPPRQQPIRLEANNYFEKPSWISLNDSQLKQEARAPAWHDLYPGEYYHYDYNTAVGQHYHQHNGHQQALVSGGWLANDKLAAATRRQHHLASQYERQQLQPDQQQAQVVYENDRSRRHRRPVEMKMTNRGRHRSKATNKAISSFQQEKPREQQQQQQQFWEEKDDDTEGHHRDYDQEDQESVVSVVVAPVEANLPLSIAEQMKQQASNFVQQYGSAQAQAHSTTTTTPHSHHRQTSTSTTAHSSNNNNNHDTDIQPTKGVPRGSSSWSSSAAVGSAGAPGRRRKPNLQVRRTLRVKIKKSKPILGIAIEGGFNVSGQLLPRIVCVHEDGAAYQCGKLRASDLILEVNGISTVNMTHDEIATTIANAYYHNSRPYIEFLIGESINV